MVSLAAIGETGTYSMISATVPPRFPVSHKIRRRLLGPALLALGLLIAAPLSVAQAAPSSAQQAPPDASSATVPGAQFRVQVPLVLEDLVVRDRSGNPVHGLKASNLTVTENAKSVTLRNFEEHIQAMERSTAHTLPDLGPNVFTNLVAAPADSPLNILLLDNLNTPMADQEFVRQQMLKYLGTLPPDVPVAIFQLDTQLHLLQGFTADPELLRAAIDKGRDIVRAPRMTDTKAVSDIDPMRYDHLSDFMAGKVDPRSINDIKRVEGTRRAAGDEQRAILTQQALIQLGRYLSGLPGRKNLIWFPASFPVGALPNILVRNRVALYPVDARGHMIPPPCLGPGCAAQLSAFEHAQLDQHLAMTQLAESTGGEAFDDTNGLKEAVEKAISDGNSYYTFAYTPPNQKLDGSYRTVAVKVDRPGLQLAYRTGYFADNPNVDARRLNAPPSALEAALTPGSPNATQIRFDVQLVPEDAPVNAVSTGASPDPSLMKPPYRRYDLHYQVAIGDASFTTASDGTRHGSLNFAVLVYSPVGALVNEIANKVNLDWSPARYAEMVHRGLRVGQTVEAPAKGDYFLRVVVYDPNGDRVGATEVPLADLKPKQPMLGTEPNVEQPAKP